MNCLYRFTSGVRTLHMECGALAPLLARNFSPRRTGMDDQTLHGGPDEQVPPGGGPDKRVPPEKTDLTSRSLREALRRGTPVVPGERKRIIERSKTGMTRRSCPAKAHRHESPRCAPAPFLAAKKKRDRLEELYIETMDGPYPPHHSSRIERGKTLPENGTAQPTWPIENKYSEQTAEEFFYRASHWIMKRCPAPAIP